MAIRKGGRNPEKRNIALSAINQFFVEAGMTVSDASMVLSLYLRALGGSNFLIGLLPSLRFFGWLVPQFVIAGTLERKRRMMPTIRLLEAVRFTSLFAVAGLTLAWADSRPRLLISVFLVLYMATRVAAGCSAVGRTEIMGHIVPPDKRSSLISLRMFAGGVAGFLSGFIVSALLDPNLIDFPQNYAILIGLAGLCFGIAVLILGFVDEPEREPKCDGLSLFDQLRAGPGVIRKDKRFRRYLFVRLGATGFQIASPFYILYATEVLGAPDLIAGAYISIRTASRVLSTLGWGRYCERHGGMRSMRYGLALGGLALTIVTCFPFLANAFWSQGIPTYAAWLFGIAFVVEGMALAAQQVGSNSYLYQVAPDDQIPTYFGLANTVMGPFYFLPALAGALLGIVGYQAIFASAAVFLFGGSAMTFVPSSQTKKKG